MAATGMLIGLSTFTTKHHICRATLEATCFQTRAILEAMAKDIGVDNSEMLYSLKVDGGMTGSDVAMQLQADILGIPVERPTMRESTALGAALLAGAALKLFGWDLEDSDSLDNVNEFGVKTFRQSISDEEKEWKCVFVMRYLICPRIHGSSVQVCGLEPSCQSVYGMEE